MRRVEREEKQMTGDPKSHPKELGLVPRAVKNHRKV